MSYFVDWPKGPAALSAANPPAISTPRAKGVAFAREKHASSRAALSAASPPALSTAGQRRGFAREKRAGSRS